MTFFNEFSNEATKKTRSSFIGGFFLFLGIMFLACSAFFAHHLHYLFLSGSDLQHPPLLNDIFTKVLTVTPLRLLISLIIYIFAKNYKFFTVIISISVSSLVLACFLLYLTDHAALHDPLHEYECTLIPSSLMGMLFMPAAICLSAPLLFKSIPSKYHSTVSACVLLTVAFGGILACSMKNTVMHMRTSMWAYALIFTATCSLCCFLVAKFYYFKAGLQAPEKNIHEGKIQFSPYILLFLSGALLGITIGFPMLLSNPYFTESLILNFAGGLFPSFLHWILLSLFLLPANYAFKKFGLVKTMYASILGTFFLAVILEHNAEMAIPTYVVFRLFIAFSSALCLVSLFLIIYKTTQKTNSIYSPVLWTSWGYIATIALRAFIGQSCQLPVILVSVLMLLIGLLLYQFMLIKYYKKDLASFSH